MSRRPELIVFRGLPGSGKTYRARQMIKQDKAVRVNKDLLREMMFFDYSTENEIKVKWLEAQIAGTLIRSRLTVLVDDTNLKSADIEFWKDLANDLDVPVFIEFIDTPLETCIERDGKRMYPVGETRIREMAEGMEK